MLSACRSGRSIGAQPWPQLPTSSVVTPWATALSAAGSMTSVRSEWLWMSMKPGVDDAATGIDLAGGLAAAEIRLPIATIRSPRMPTSPRTPGAPEPSTIDAAVEDDIGAVVEAAGERVRRHQIMIYDTKMPPRDLAAA